MRDSGAVIDAGKRRGSYSKKYGVKLEVCPCQGAPYAGRPQGS
jgi:hypothetical protein